MRYTIFCIFCFWFLSAFAYQLSKNTAKALDTLEHGSVSQAIQELKDAVAVNDIVAQFYMGQCYELGIGIESDKKAAFGMYRRAAERGFPLAMKELARCYREGIGVGQNEIRANEWLDRFAKRDKGFSLPDISELYMAGNSQTSDIAVNFDNKSVSKINTKSSEVGQFEKRDTSKDIVYANKEIKKSENAEIKSDVDIDIPSTNRQSENSFALIIANENYQDVVPVSNALNDGEIFAVYCKKILGLPETNIHLIKDATLNNIKREINLMKQIAQVYSGQASFIVYYAGHGIPDENSRNAFLMPVDGFSADLSTCYSLAEFYEIFGEMPSQKTVIFLDACFSGSVRGNGMLASARGVAIKPKTGAPSGKTVVISSAMGDETAYPFEEKNHGLFTYYLLKKLKESKGDVSLGLLLDYIKNNVLKKSLIVNGKSQTPTAIPSQTISNEWYNWKLN